MKRVIIGQYMGKYFRVFKVGTKIVFMVRVPGFTWSKPKSTRAKTLTGGVASARRWIMQVQLAR